MRFKTNMKEKLIPAPFVVLIHGPYIIYAHSPELLMDELSSFSSKYIFSMVYIHILTNKLSRRQNIWVRYTIIQEIDLRLT